MLSLVMAFGWAGAPGEFVMWATAAQKHHGSPRPTWPAFNDTVPYTSKRLMDDGAAAERPVGIRMSRSLAWWTTMGVQFQSSVREAFPS